jgi:hypothetical protein
MHREMGRLDPYIPNGCKDNKGIQHAVQSLRVLGAGLVARIQLTNSVRGREGAPTRRADVPPSAILGVNTSERWRR